MTNEAHHPTPDLREVETAAGLRVVIDAGAWIQFLAEVAALREAILEAWSLIVEVFDQWRDTFAAFHTAARRAEDALVDFVRDYLEEGEPFTPPEIDRGFDRRRPAPVRSLRSTQARRFRR